MPDTITQKLDKIILISQQILLGLKGDVSVNKTEDGTHEDNKKNDLIEELLSLTAKRDQLITTFFERYNTEVLIGYQHLLNKLMLQDAELKKISSNTQQNLKKSLLSIKKSKKVSNAYKKY